MKRGLSFFLLLFLCLSFALTACSGKGETISVYIGDALSSFDPVKDVSKTAQAYICNLFSGLYEYREDENGIPTLTPADAQGFPTVRELEDGKSELTFHLKDGLTWSNGEQITPQDYVYSWNRAAEYSLYNATETFFSVIDGYDSYLEYEDDAALNMSYDNKSGTFSVVIDGEVERFLANTTQTVFFPISRIAERDSKDWSKTPEDFASNGPFTLKELKKDRAVFKKNENFRDAQNVPLSEITFFFDKEIAQKQQKKGKLAFCSADVLGNETTVRSTSIGVQYLAFNVNDPALALFNDDEKQKIRTAVGIYISEVYQTDGLIPCLENDNQASYDDAQSLVSYADSLLEQVASSSERYTYQDGAVYEFPFLKAICAGREGEKQTLERMASVLAKKGIHLSITNASWEDFLSLRGDGEWSLMMNAWVYDTASPTELLHLFTADSPYNDALAGMKEKPSFWREQYDAILAEADGIADYRSAYNALKNTGAVIPVAELTTTYAVADWIEGLTVLSDGIPRFAYAYQKSSTH